MFSYTVFILLVICGPVAAGLVWQSAKFARRELLRLEELINTPSCLGI